MQEDVPAGQLQDKNMDEELQYCRKRLENIIARCVEGIVVADQSGIIRFVNEAAVVLLHRRKEELLGLPFRVPLTREESNEMTIRLPGGKMQVLEMVVTETTWEEKPAWLIALHDISAQRRAEQEYRLLYRAVRQNPVMIVVTDAEGIAELVNPKFTEVTGYSSDEVVGKKLYFLDFDRMPIEDYVRLWPAMSEGREWHGELLSRKKNGHSYWQSLHISPVKEQEDLPPKWVVVSEDVTARKKMEEDRARLASIVDSSDDAIIGKTLDGIITSWNFGAQEMYGYTPDEVIGEPISMLAPPERADEITGILEKIRRGERIRHFETERVAKSGKRLRISLTISPIIDQDNRIVGASAIARDITDRQHAFGVKLKHRFTGWFPHKDER